MSSEMELERLVYVIEPAADVAPEKIVAFVDMIEPYDEESGRLAEMLRRLSLYLGAAIRRESAWSSTG
jgi:hypothetical protein